MKNLEWLKITDRNFEKIEDKPGLYIISLLFDNGMYYAMFVDKSEHLKESITRCFSKKEVDPDLKEFLASNFSIKVSYCYCDSNILDGTKMFLIGTLNPLFNDEIVDIDEKYRCSLPSTNKCPI